jgi:hypothetical protein
MAVGFLNRHSVFLLNQITLNVQESNIAAFWDVGVEKLKSGNGVCRIGQWKQKSL